MKLYMHPNTSQEKCETSKGILAQIKICSQNFEM